MHENKSNFSYIRKGRHKKKIRRCQNCYKQFTLLLRYAIRSCKNEPNDLTTIWLTLSMSFYVKKKKAFRRTIHSVIRTSQNVKRSCRKVFLAKQLLFLVFRSDWQKNSDISGFSLGLVNLLSEKDSITQQPVKKIKTSATIFRHTCTRRNSKRMKVRRQWDMKPSSTVEITHTAHTKKKENSGG